MRALMLATTFTQRRFGTFLLFAAFFLDDLVDGVANIRDRDPGYHFSGYAANGSYALIKPRAI